MCSAWSLSSNHDRDERYLNQAAWNPDRCVRGAVRLTSVDVILGIKTSCCYANTPCRCSDTLTILLLGGRPGPARFSKVVMHQNTLYIAGAFVDECLSYSSVTPPGSTSNTAAGQVPFDTSDTTYKGQTEQVHLMHVMIDWQSSTFTLVMRQAQ